MNCKTIVEKVDESTEGLEYSGKGKCLGCGEDTEYTYKISTFVVQVMGGNTSTDTKGYANSIIYQMKLLIPNMRG